MNLADYIPINFTIARHPYNWLVITAVLFAGGLAASLIFHPSSQSADDATT